MPNSSSVFLSRPIQGKEDKNLWIYKAVRGKKDQRSIISLSKQCIHITGNYLSSDTTIINKNVDFQQYMLFFVSINPSIPYFSLDYIESTPLTTSSLCPGLTASLP